MDYITETYRAEGWTEDQSKTMSERTVARIRDACVNRRLTEDDVLSAADNALGLGVQGGPYHGQRRVKKLNNWEWFLGWIREEG